LELESLVPKNFVIVQRTRNRRISNIEPFFEGVRKAHPNDNWVIHINPSKSLSDEIRFWANCTVAVYVRGSMAANCVWMRPNSVVVEIAVRFCDGFFVDIARAVGLKIFGVAFTGNSPHENPVDIDVMLQVIGRAYDFLKGIQ
jgi:hypothetical protein